MTLRPATSTGRLSPAARVGLQADLERAHMASVAADRQLSADVREARRRGLSWSSIGDALGISKQLAHQRYALTESRSVAYTDEPIPLNHGRKSTKG